ncbi:MAG: hypothetical protein LUE27_00400 [Clostridia bacterium]|nr:hypothetical protein [Clostridia bacterium]
MTLTKDELKLRQTMDVVERVVFDGIAYFDTQRDETVTVEELNKFYGGRKLTMIRKAIPGLMRKGLIECYSTPFYEKRYKLTDNGREQL